MPNGTADPIAHILQIASRDEVGLAPVASSRSLYGNAQALKAVYTRMNENILRVVCSVPAGRVTTVDAISQFLLVPAHHVTFLMARRFGADGAAVPWHRVLAHRGAIGRPLLDAKGRTQAQALMMEDVLVDYRGRVGDFARRFYQPTTISTGITP